MIHIRHFIILGLLAVVANLLDRQERTLRFREARRRARPITHPWEFWPGRDR